MKKALLFVAIVLIVAAGVWGIVRSKNSNKTADNDQSQSQQDDNGKVAGASSIKSTPGSDIILFVGDGCSHCKKVEEYIKTNKIDEKIQLDFKEIWYNKENAAVMKEKAAICKIPEDELGVPLLFDGSASKCYVGEVEIENFLNLKINAQ
ncbi:MAG: hypothetical protein WC536_02095 [Patescibacteria group bacterium]